MADYFETYRIAEATYQPNPDVRKQLAAKSLVMLVGPSAVGKSTVMNHIASIDSRFARVSGVTTRPQRANDEPGLYRYAPTPDDMAVLEAYIKNGELVQFAVHPTKAVLYGTLPQDYPGEYNLQDTLSGAVTHYMSLGFRACTVVGLVANGATWQSWFQSRFDPGNTQDCADARARLDEAILSLTWLTDYQSRKAEHITVEWVKNTPHNLDASAHDVIAAATRVPGNVYAGADIARDMLTAANELKVLYNDGTA